MTKSTALFICFLTSSLLHSQSKITIYYDQDWKITTVENFQFRREASMDFHKIRFSGTFKDLNKDAHLIGEGAYLNGMKIGNHKTYFDDGNIKSSINWKGDDFTIIELHGDTPDFTVSKGTGKFKLPYSFPSSRTHGTLVGEFKENKRVGKWFYTDSTEKVLYEETYSRGEFKKALRHKQPDMIELIMKKAIVDKGGVATPIETTEPVDKLVIKIRPYEIIDFFEFDKSKFKNLFYIFSQAGDYCNPEFGTGVRFLGGDSAFSAAVSKSIRYPAIARRNNLGGQVFVKIIIGYDGTAKKYSIVKTTDSTNVFADEALRVAKSFEFKWFPAQNKCSYFESFVIVPITFQVSNKVIIRR